MANSNKVFVSPGVYTSERDLSFVAQSVGITTLGIVGETQSGPAFEPIFISNFNEFRSYFGDTNPEKYPNTQIPKYEASYIAKSYLDESNRLYVTRVLGLSGYDAGPSWTLKTIGNLNSEELNETGNVGATIGFSGNLLTGEVTFSGVPQIVDDVFNKNITLFDGTTTSLDDEFTNIILDEVSNNNIGTGVYVFGSLPQSDLNNLISSATNYEETINVLGVDNVELESNDLKASVNDVWYYGLFDYSSANDIYDGFGHAMFIDSAIITGDTFTGELIVSLNTFTSTPLEKYHNVAVATLRSRGINTFVNDDGPVYEVDTLNNVTLDFTNQFSFVNQNPFGDFKIDIENIDGTQYSFITNLDVSSSKYLNKVFGGSNFSRNRKEIPLFVEESYPNIINEGFRQGMIRGLSDTLVSLPSAREDNGTNTSIGWYLDKYQSAKTPYIVSEVRGNGVVDLFKFITISDGNGANREVKISISNISFNNGTFDVLVRDFFDTDSNQRILEKFTGCTMNPSLNSYIGKKIGTFNGDYEMRSRYITLEISDDAPIDALPCGFKGYNVRNYSGAKAPFLTLKTKYFTPGEIIANPPFGNVLGADNLVRSNGDNIRRTFLGVSNTSGIDSDFFEYKGKQNPTNIAFDLESSEWSDITKGFHMDANADTVMFEVGESSFSTEPTTEDNVYLRLNSRKFTVAPYGGFDGWNIYNESRTNGDRFALGALGFLRGAPQSITYPNATGWGAFKQITGPEDERWANTDYFAFLKGIRTFSNPEDIDINLFVTPGIDIANNSNLIELTTEMVETERRDSIYFPTLPDYNMFVKSTNSFDSDFIKPREVVDILEESGLESNYASVFYPWILRRDTVNNTQVYIPPTAEVVKNFALTDNISYPWFASAGYTRGIVNSIRGRKKLTENDRDVLYSGRINPIATFNDVGTLVWGNKNLQRAESSLNRINVRRLLLRARKLISSVAVRLLFDQNDDTLVEEFENAVNPILESIRRDRGLTEFRVEVQNTPEDRELNQLVGKIYIKPTLSLEFIDLEFLITPQGASFEDI